uniref:Rac/Cdc42 guanine nucleotide exchange factor (GEF) 6 n=1 Tax=Neogobius melanostomus TaxID=47308 RepID=A0A8C6SPU9_9GOBI
MNPEEQAVTWLISLGVLSSPKKNISDPEDFLKTSLKDGVVLCRLAERLIPGFTPKYCQDPKTEVECLGNIREFLKGCSSLKVEGFEPDWLYTGENFNKVLNTLLAVNFATQGQSLSFGEERSCPASGLPSPSQSSHTLSTVKSKGSLRRQSKSAEMAENGGSSGQLMVKARFNFKQNNEDELSFNKGDMILVTRQEEGGWWEGTLNGRTGWFPSNYVREVKTSEKPVSPKGAQLTKNYFSVVVQDILEYEREFVKDLQIVLGSYLRPLQASDKLSTADSATLGGNLEEILTFQLNLIAALEEFSECQQRVAGCYVNLMNQIRTLYLAYCSSHPSAVCILTDHSDELDKFMESQGASGPGILTLTTSLSKPFIRLDKYPTLLQELERHVEETHPDYPDIIKATAAFKHLMQCQNLRKRKNLELQILSEPVRGWEGDCIKTLGQVAYMSQVHVKTYWNLLQSPDIALNSAGSAIERITVFCNSALELQEWLEHLQPFTKGGSPVGTILKTVEGKSLSIVGTPTHLSHSGSLSINKPWSLSCLRPAPPLKPSAALGYKERMSYIMKDSSKSPRPMKKFLPGNRKKERKPSDDDIHTRRSTVALEEDAQILRVIEAYCTGASLHQSTTAVRKECVPQVLLPEEEKIIVEEMKSNGQTVIEEKSLVDAVYALKDEVHELKNENRWMKQFLEEEQKSRKELERVVRKLAKQKNDGVWEDGTH